MAKQNRAQKKTVGRVMHEFKRGQLKSSRGGRVKTRKQAIAIGLSEAGASKRQSPAKNRRHPARTKSREAKRATGKTRPQSSASHRRVRSASTSSGRSRARTSRRSVSSTGKTKHELYMEAQRRDIPGRSRMTKAQLARAVASR
jgi:hypothetical protein